MVRIAKVFLFLGIGFLAYSYWATPAAASWSQEWTQNYPPENVGPFTQIEFFIMPGAPTGVAFEAVTSISPDTGSAGDWTSVVPNAMYSLLTGPTANSAYLTTYFSGPSTASFTLDFVLWNGSSVVERQEFQWLGGAWEDPNGTLLSNVPGDYNRDDIASGSGPPSLVPILSSILLLGPVGVGIFIIRRRTVGAV
jgi:hypothetical protein